MVISIHAPAKGATRQLVAYHHDWKISIHAPAKGATCGVPSRTQHNTISIHAPAKGATIRQQVDHHALKISIHAPAKGATDFTTREIILFRHFNPRSREGSDRTSIIKFIIIFYFNPRSREGSDACGFEIIAGGIISIHAPAKGATIVRAGLLSLRKPISIHAPAKGATAEEEREELAEEFQSTLPRRERRMRSGVVDKQQRFQSTLPRRERPCPIFD